jgi:hypothetical protein
MPTDTLGEGVQGALKGAADYIRSTKPDDRRRSYHLGILQNLAARLQGDIQERQTRHEDDLGAKEQSEINAQWELLGEDAGFFKQTRSSRLINKHLIASDRSMEEHFPKISLPYYM